jgi:hypothetical protein
MLLRSSAFMFMKIPRLLVLRTCCWSCVRDVRRAYVDGIQPYSSRKRRNRRGRISGRGIPLTRGITRPAIQVERGEPFGLDHVSGIGGTEAKAVRVSPAWYRRCCCPLGLAPPHRQPLCRSSELKKACPGADRLSGTCISSSGTGASHLLPVVAPAAFKRSAVDEERLERVELPRAD